MRHPFHFALSALVVASAAATLAPTDARAQGTVQGGWSTGTGPQGWSTGPAQPAPYAAPQSGSPGGDRPRSGNALCAVGGLRRGHRHLARRRALDRRPRSHFLPPAILASGGAGRGVLPRSSPNAPRHAGGDRGGHGHRSGRRGRHRELPVRAYSGRRPVGLSRIRPLGLHRIDGWHRRRLRHGGLRWSPSPKTSLLLGSSVALGHRRGKHVRLWREQGAVISETPTTRLRSAGSSATTRAWSAQRPCRRSGCPRTSRSPGCGSALAPVVGVSLPVYLFYAGGDHDARRGLILPGHRGNARASRRERFSRWTTKDLRPF